MFGVGWTEFICIILVLLLFLGAQRLPEIGRSLGEAIREFREITKKRD